jgi:hypothetical protein
MERAAVTLRSLPPAAALSRTTKFRYAFGMKAPAARAEAAAGRGLSVPLTSSCAREKAVARFGACAQNMAGLSPKPLSGPRTNA